MKRLVVMVVAGLLLSGPALPAARFISHRGESGSYPENTMAAFRAAVTNGADGFECDVHLTADNEIVCIHDATTTRTTDGSLTVASSTLAQLKALDAGSWKGAQFAGERIPELSEALSLARDGFEIFVEVKCGTEIIPRLAQVIGAEPKATPERVVFIGFSQTVITALRAAFPAYRAYWLSSLTLDGNNALTPSASAMVATLQGMNASGLDVQDISALTEAYIDEVKAAGLGFHVWTVNDMTRARALSVLGADTVTSDTAASFARMLAADVPQPVPPPVVHWTFDNGSLANSGTGGPQYDAVLCGTAALTNESISGGGLWFPGKAAVGGTNGSCYAILPNYQLGEQGSIAFWYNPSRFYSYNSLFDNSINADQWEMWIYDNGNAIFRIRGASNTGQSYSLNARRNGTNSWVHFAVTWDRNAAANGIKMYINGLFEWEGNITEWANPGTVYFGGGNIGNGSGNSGNTPAEGIMDDVRVYDYPLTARQVRDVHAEIASEAPVVHLTLDGTLENSGTGGARYDATLNNATAWTNGVNNKGQALMLCETNSFLAVPFRMNRNGTVALWYYTPPPFYNYLSPFDNQTDPDRYECWFTGAGSINFRVAGSTVSWTNPDRDNATNNWWHIVATWDALSSNQVLYVNGVERGRNAIANTTIVPGTAFYVGGGHSGNKPPSTYSVQGFKSLAADVQVFETALSPTRVAEIFAEQGRRGTPGPIAYLPLDKTFVDVAGSHDVTVSGSPTFVKSQGGFGRALAYTPSVVPPPGGSGGAHVSVTNVMGATAGTIATWYYARGPWYNWQPLWDNTVHTEFWESWIDNTGTLYARVTNIGNYRGIVSCNLNTLRGSNNWYHVAWTWDLAAQQAKLYVDGILRSTGILMYSGWRDPNPSFNIGSFHPANMAANGIWDEVRVYDRALSLAEVQELAIIPPPPPPPGTILLVR